MTAGRAAPVPAVPDEQQDAVPPGVDTREQELRDAQSALLNILEDFAEGEGRLKDTQSAVLNILEDSAADRLAAEAAFKASVNILSDLSDAEAEVRRLNAELETRVALRTAELERANKNLRAFTYSVAHDLRTPLRALSGFSDALAEDYGDRLDETGRGYAGSIKAASERMAALIDDLLLLSQVSRAGMNLQPVDLSAAAAAIAAELRSRDPGRAVRFTLQDGIRVIADRSLIRTVLENLLENAWKFTARRDGAVIEFATSRRRRRGRRGLLLRARQRGRLRPRLCGQAVPAVRAAARRRRVPRHRHRPGQRRADHRTARRAGLGRRRRRPRRHLLLHPHRRSPSMKRRGFGGAAVTTSLQGASPVLQGGVSPVRRRRAGTRT